MMDTTREYIKMCEKAGEIQNNLPDVDDAKSFWGEGDNFSPFNTWLPRQDQLQEIWIEEYLKRPSSSGWFGEFCNFMEAPYSDGAISDEFFDSMEQLWLAFVMKEKYGKVWNGEEWA